MAFVILEPHHMDYTQALQLLHEGQLRIEAKLDELLLALNDEEPQPQTTLDGEAMGRERDQSQSLDADTTGSMG